MITLEEAIAHAEEVCSDKSSQAEHIRDKMKSDIAMGNATELEACAADHKQLAEWLKELKRYKDSEKYEKRELRLQISQLLADAGLNQGTIKEMVEVEIKNKVERAVKQTLDHLNAQTSSGDFIDEQVKKYLRSEYMNSYAFTNAIKEEIKNRVIQIVIKDVEEAK